MKQTGKVQVSLSDKLMKANFLQPKDGQYSPVIEAGFLVFLSERKGHNLGWGLIWTRSLSTHTFF